MNIVDLIIIIIVTLLCSCALGPIWGGLTAIFLILIMVGGGGADYE